MTKGDIDLLAIDRGVVEAPAGCGKTHLICDAVGRHKGDKPLLVLTHTNAGVAALRARLTKAGVPANSYRLSTLDGLTIRLVSSFPQRSGVDSEILLLTDPSNDYSAIRDGAFRLLSEGHVHDILCSSYSRLIVDEYQDCCVQQHELVASISDAMPTCILGDPLQAVFGWLGLPDWEGDVCNLFPRAGTLGTPWRWVNAGTEEFGQWLLDLRATILNGEIVDLEHAPEEVVWIQLDPATKRQSQLRAARTPPATPNGSVLILGDGRKPYEHRKFASQTPGAVTIENVDLRDLIGFAESFEFDAPEAFEKLLEFASSIMRNVGRPGLLKRVSSLERGTARVEASRAENAALRFKAAPTPTNAVNFLVELENESGVTSHRPAVLRSCIRSLSLCSCSCKTTFLDAAVCVREQSRQLGRSLPRKAVGSPLLLKGLEAEVAVVLDTADHDDTGLYVSMTRGSHRLVVCSESSRIK